MATINTPKSFTLNAVGSPVQTVESLNIQQGVYYQFRLQSTIPYVTEVSIGLKGTSGTYDFMIKIFGNG